LAEYLDYLKIKAQYTSKYEKAKKTYDNFQTFAATSFLRQHYFICPEKKDYTAEDVQSLKVEVWAKGQIKKFMVEVMKKALTAKNSINIESTSKHR
jgi:hypothetical protein